MLITNFNKKDFKIYKEAVQLYKRETGDTRLYVDKNAYVGNTKQDDLCALRSAWNSGDLSGFWDIFDMVEKRHLRNGTLLDSLRRV